MSGYGDPDGPIVPPASRRVGYRFRRPLTEDEFKAITQAESARGTPGGLDGAFRATWDILARRGRRYDPGGSDRARPAFPPAEYAIPESQHEPPAGHLDHASRFTTSSGVRGPDALVQPRSRRLPRRVAPTCWPYRTCRGRAPRSRLASEISTSAVEQSFQVRVDRLMPMLEVGVTGRIVVVGDRSSRSIETVPDLLGCAQHAQPSDSRTREGVAAISLLTQHLTMSGVQQSGVRIPVSVSR